ncbi:MAG: glycosyltransferase family 39 protein [bacterium]|nr:glycosyltransferase family 39 protein [bacterium]
MNQFTASLWGDEAWAATLAVKPLIDIIQIVSKDTAPPLYYIFLHLWMQIFGTSETAIRSLSFLFFLGTVLTVFLIGRHLWDKKTGLLAALLTFVNPFLFQYAFEGRMYSLLAFTSTLSIYFFLRKKRLGFILATTAALYTHHFAIFIVAFEGLWMLTETLAKSPGKIIKNLSDFFFIGLLYLPWLYPLYYQTSLVSGGFWLGKPQLSDIKELLRKFLVGSGEGLVQQALLWATLVVFVLRRWQQDLSKTIFLVGWLFTPIIITFLISQKFQPIFYDRYMLIAIPASCLLLASLSRKLSLPFFAFILISLAFLNWQYFTHPTKRPFRQLSEYVKTEAPNTQRINYNGSAHHLFESKYYGIPAPIYSPTPLPFYTGTALMEKSDVISVLPKTKEILTISSEPPEKVVLPGWKQEKNKRFGSLTLVWFTKEK